MAGVGHEFTESPPPDYQVECPVCSKVLQEPYQTSCCQRNFCKECIEPVRNSYGACPACNCPNFDYFYNKGLETSLNDFEVYCSHKSKGCEWRGELRELDKHLNSEPPADKSLEGCPFTVISCPLSSTGCDVKLPRREVTTHLSEAVVTHIQLQSEQTQRLILENQGLKSHLRRIESRNEQIECDVDKLYFEKTQLAERVASLEEHVKVLSGNEYKFTMPNFFKYRHKRKEWCSVPFYTHPQGYKMCLVCNATETGGNPYLSVFACLMLGEYDEFLEWPLRGEMTFHLLDQTGGHNHLKRMVKLNDKLSPAAVNRVRGVSGVRAEIGVGFPHFIALADLHPKYLKNDCLLFKITDIKVMDRP